MPPPPPPQPAAQSGSREGAAAELGIATWHGSAVPMHLGMAVFTPAPDDEAARSDAGAALKPDGPPPGGDCDRNRALQDAPAAGTPEGAGRAASGSGAIGFDGGAAAPPAAEPTGGSAGYGRQRCFDIWAEAAAAAGQPSGQGGLQAPPEAEGAMRDLDLLLPPKPPGPLPRPPPCHTTRDPLDTDAV